MKVRSIDVSRDVLWQAGMAVAKKAYAMARAVCPVMGLVGGGARGLHHFTEMVGADAAVTINWLGTADKLIEQDPIVLHRFLAPVPESVIDEFAEKVEDFRRGYFADAMEPRNTRISVRWCCSGRVLRVDGRTHSTSSGNSGSSVVTSASIEPPRGRKLLPQDQSRCAEVTLIGCRVDALQTSLPRMALG